MKNEKIHVKDQKITKKTKITKKLEIFCTSFIGVIYLSIIYFKFLKFDNMWNMAHF